MDSSTSTCDSHYVSRTKSVALTKNHIHRRCGSLRSRAASPDPAMSTRTSCSEQMARRQSPCDIATMFPCCAHSCVPLLSVWAAAEPVVTALDDRWAMAVDMKDSMSRSNAHRSKNKFEFISAMSLLHKTKLSYNDLTMGKIDE